MKTEQARQNVEPQGSDPWQVSDRARSTAGVRSLHTREVAGSIPAAPTRELTVTVKSTPWRSANGTSAATAYVGGKRMRITIPREGDARITKEMHDAISGYMTAETVTPQVRAILQHRLSSAKSRKKRDGIYCELTIADLEEMYATAAGRCTISGIPFDITNGDDRKWRRPFRPSIDRINADGHYTRDNTRLVCSLLNFAMGAWGEGALRFMMAFSKATR